MKNNYPYNSQPNPANQTKTPGVNCLVITRSDSSTGAVVTPLLLEQISNGSSLQFSDNQVQKGISYQPIRREQQYLNFTALWSKQNYDQYFSFSQALRQHYLYTVDSVTNPKPMVLIYYPNNLTYYGFIETTDAGDERFMVLYRKQFTMRIALGLAEAAAGVIANTSQFIPNAKSVGEYGLGWYSIFLSNNYGGLPSDLNNIIPPDLRAGRGGIYEPPGTY